MKEQEPIIKPYNDLLHKIIEKGFKTDTTIALIDESITFDLNALNQEDHYSLILPKNRAYLDTSSKYAIAEAIWYRAATRSIDIIKPFGRIWEQMIDHEGQINSNYGYQIKNNNISLDDSTDQLLKKGKVSLYIASFKNQDSASDLVCNNKITFYYDSESKKLECLIHARSIDVLFGLPYDFFAAQGLMTMIAHLINKKTNTFTLLETMTFSVANIHWYLSQKPNKESLQYLSNDVIVIEDSNSTPYSNDYQYKEISTDEVKKYRDNIDYQSLVYEIVNKKRDLNIYSGFDYHYTHATLEEAIDFYKDEIHYEEEHFEFLNHHINIIKQRLEKNPWDRKSLLVLPHLDLFYIMFDGQEYHVLGVLN